MIAAVELALLEQLRNPAFGYSYRVLETFPDDLDAYLKNVGNLRTPAAWSSWLDFPNGDDAGDETGWCPTARFVLAVATQNQRNEQDARHGDGALPGSYQLVEDAIRALSGNWLEPLDLVEPVRIISARPTVRTPQMEAQRLSVVALTLQCRVALGSFETALGEFRTFHADWDVPAFGNVAAPLPSAQHDAEDQVELPYD